MCSRPRTSSYLTIAKVLNQKLASIKKCGVKNKAFGFNLAAPATVKEAEKLHIRDLYLAFSHYVRLQIKHFHIENKVAIIRRPAKKEIYIVSKQVGKEWERKPALIVTSPGKICSRTRRN